MSEPSTALSDSIAWTIRSLALVLLIIAGLWLLSGFRTIEPGSQAVVEICGRIVRVEQKPGRVWVWPAPFSRITLLSAPDRHLQHDVGVLSFAGDWADKQDVYKQIASEDDMGEVYEKLIEKGHKDGLTPREDGSYILTADNAICHVRGQVIYSIQDPVAFLTRQDALALHLDRFFARGVIFQSSRHSLEMLLTKSLGEVKTAIAQQMNQSLGEQGLDFGILIERVDMQMTLPVRAQRSFDRAQEAQAKASQTVAQAKTRARSIATESVTMSANIRNGAQAFAEETQARALSHTQPIEAILSATTERSQLQERLYRETMAAILKRVDKVTLVPPDKDIRLLLPGDVQ